MKMPSYQELMLWLNFNTETRIDFYEELNLSLKNGDSLVEALTEARSASLKKNQLDAKGNPKRDKKGRPVQSTDGMSWFISRLIDDVASGTNFQDAIAPFVGYSEAGIIAAGEDAGNLSGAFERVGGMLRRKAKIRRTLFAAVGPLVGILLCIIGVFVFLGDYLVPMLVSLLPIDKWTGPTHRFLTVSAFFMDYVWLIAAGLLALTIAIWIALPRWTGRSRDLCEQIPMGLSALFPLAAVLPIYKILAATDFMMNISTRVAQGISLRDALARERKNATPYMDERLVHITRGVANGVDFGQALEDAEHDFPDRRVISTMKKISAKNGFAQAMERYANDWCDRKIRDIEKIAQQMRISMYLIAGYSLSIIGLGIIGIQSGMTAALGG